jgi:hypothetical protein
MHIEALMARATFDLSLGTSIQLRLKTYCALKAYILLSVTAIAKNLGISRQLAQFHFEKHVLGKNLIEGYEVFVMRYGETPYVMVLFVISFHNCDALARFARSLLDKFFVLTMGKILRGNVFLVETYLPTGEFRKFIDALSALAEMKLVKDYKYVIQDLGMRSRQTISGEFFKGKSWVYDHEGHLGTLRRKVTSPRS